MSFDGIMTRAMVTELANALTTGRISKIYQPYKTELVLTIRANGKNHQLLLSANANFARAHLTKEKYDNPSIPPMFCMLLRKHLEGSVIEQIQQEEMERIITFDVKNKDELGDVTYKRLIVEIMGRHSNIILIDRSTGMVLDSIKHISLAQSSYRSVYPGQTYKSPPEQDKVNPIFAQSDEILKQVDFNSGKLDRQLVEHFAGLSPLLAKEIVSRAGMINRTSLPAAFDEVFQPIRNHEYQPEMVVSQSKEYFSVVPLTHIKGDRKDFGTVSELLDRFYYGKAERDRVKQQAFDLDRFLRNELQKNKKKIKKLTQTLVESEKAKLYQKQGELLTANLHAIQRGQKAIEVIDYYDEEAPFIEIALDPSKSPSDNAQAYFKRYNKAKNAVAIVEVQIVKAKEEIQYLEQLLQQMESASPKDITEIREELIEEGYIRRRQKQQKKKKKEEKPQLDRYTSSTGIDFYAGKNNKQNEYLTTRFARQDEIWLHTKDIPGSHVLIRSIEPDETTLKEAASVAAYFSKAKLSSSVPVDFTKIRHVKKPNGSKPGFVIYDNQTTLFVTPSEDLVLALRSRT
ncbi:Rqc2 family fibronectin-binding protein [Bacillus solitudinis]|uniref:Rqc2 family fibronectin-binding protein n=1 Tax=Bacillus solitudinis TaxID=2014074 RepID=UPI000C24F9BB|nr:NFACT RNA binding domain-containing protein [Bacillus solitudinis]